MAYNGSGTYSLPLANVVTGTTISSTWANTTLSDIATALSSVIVKDGQTTTTAPVPFVGGINLTSVAGTSYVSTTFTPSLLSGGNQVGRTYGTQAGRYVRIGNAIHWWAAISLTAVGASTGTTTVAGLPFAAATVTGMLYAQSIVADDLAAGTTTALGAYIASATTEATIGVYSAGQFTAMQETALSATTAIYVSGIYLV